MMKGTPCSRGNDAQLKASSKTHHVTRSTNSREAGSCRRGAAGAGRKRMGGLGGSNDIPDVCAEPLATVGRMRTMFGLMPHDPGASSDRS